MSKKTTDRTFEDGAHRAIDAVCNEFRRRLKKHLVDSENDSITAEQVFSAAQTVTDSNWLAGFRINEQINKAA